MRISRHINLLLFIFIFMITAGSVLASVEINAVHKENGVACADCHGTDTPDKPAKNSACFTCHESYKAIAERTKDVPEANPHASHLGDIDCYECHGIHKPSEFYCNKECHNFDIKMPK